MKTEQSDAAWGLAPLRGRLVELSARASVLIRIRGADRTRPSRPAALLSGTQGRGNEGMARTAAAKRVSTGGL
jgi:hypothetical protein